MQSEKLWLKNYPQGVAAELDYPEETMPQLLEKVAAAFPGRTAVIFAQLEIPYAMLNVMVDKMATAFYNLGVRKGDRVALMAPNCPQYIVGFFAVQKAGGIVVQVNPMYVERELEHILNDSGAEIIVAFDQFYPRIKNVRELTPLKHVILFSLGQPAAEGEAEVLKAEELLASTEANPPKIDFDVVNDLAVLQYTGGTTGVSKGAMLTHRNIVANALQVTQWFQGCKYGEEVVLSVLPFFHSYGMTTCVNFGIANAATLVVLPRFEIESLLQTIDKYKPTLFPGVPTMYIAVNNHPEIGKYDVKSIKYCISGSAPLPVEVSQKFEALTGGCLVEGYGLSETSPVTHCNPMIGVRKAGSIGMPLSNTVCKIMDLEMGQKELPPGEIGELCISGPQVMKGYWNMPEESGKTLVNGWLYTGDIAKMDEDGYFYIVDRKKDMVIAGGFNIYPRDVEEVLFEHPKVQEAVVAGVPDPYRGETVKAFIVLKEGMESTEQEMIDFCRGKLAAYKVPKLVEFRKELPKTIVGKVLRRFLREEEVKKQQGN
ncbi:long-chain-fatty-acid--CoA ligase [Desulfocucumis palustris]|uniref:Long-chain-fatty-acid--CoA ligase n=1 Tax=Desulfocucumis palustris TaxID=1898651 RepID=A0A2L2XDY2_9FIRM|nr:long-chain fatty acid--CoA ligase [Desulfocucumis palustris]GBF34557.1 long-chain-fatty-acid--CoA ligase [Desulfocucumis palustris]